MSIFGSLEIGTRSLNASQTAISVTGQNISNANTEGYSRKRLDQASASRRDSSFGQMGFGVDIISVSRLRDTFLDQQIAEQTTDKGYYQEIDDALQRLENIFVEPSESSLGATVDDFWDAWQDLANNPSDLSSREVVKSTSLVLTDQMHSLAQEMEDFRHSRDLAIENTVKELNRLSREIYNLNLEIASVESGFNKQANDSRDRRDILVKRLSEIVDVQFVEDDLGRLTVTTAGNIIVGPTEVVEIELARRSISQTDGTLRSEQILRFANSKQQYKPQGGKMAGLLQVRNEIVPEYEDKLDLLAKTMVQSVNEIHKRGYDLNHNTGIWFFDETKLTAKDISIAPAILNGAENIAAAQGGVAVGPITIVSPADMPGIPAQANPVLDLKSINPSYRNLLQTGTEVVLTANGSRLNEGAGKDYVVDHENGTIQFLNYSRYSAGDNISVTFSYNQMGFPGEGNGQNALNISQLRSKASMFQNLEGDYTQSMGEYYSSFIGTLGVARNQASSNLETREFLIEQFDKQQLELSGVSLDEEMANMIKFETSYQASARYISTISQLLDVLMNM